MCQVTIVASDLHDRSMFLDYAVGIEEPRQRSFGNDPEGRQAMIDFLLDFARRRGSDRIVFVYEASGQGFGLYDLLTDYGIECHVVSPTHLTKSAKQKKNKTDAKDARHLFEAARGHVLAGNKLPVVWPPPRLLRNDRELIRARLETAEAGTALKLQILALLKRQGCTPPKNYHWTKAFLRWLKDLAARLPETVAPVLAGLLARLEVIGQQLVQLDREVRKLSQTERYRAPCAALRKLPGVGLLTAMAFLTEMGDLTRFPNRRKVAAYLGLSPSAYESGDVTDRKGHIPRGSARCCARPPGRRSAGMRKRAPTGCGSAAAARGVARRPSWP